MHKTLNKILPLCTIWCFLSCTHSLEEIPSYAENINGFSITWRKNVTEQKKEVIRDILKDMQWVEGGTFLMGATQEQADYARVNEYPAHYVQLSDYYIGRNEISIEQVETLLDVEYSEYDRQQGSARFSWKEWQYFIQIIREFTNLCVDFPTEAQWEYAARGGKLCNGYIFSGGNDFGDFLLYEDVENELGLLNMAMGHSEWCKDAYNRYSDKILEINPYYSQGLGHVVRGGNSKSLDINRDYFNHLTTSLITDRFIHSYDDYRACRVSARSYCDETYNSMLIYISCRLVININD